MTTWTTLYSEGHDEHPEAQVRRPTPRRLRAPRRRGEGPTEGVGQRVLPTDSGGILGPPDGWLRLRLGRNRQPRPPRQQPHARQGSHAPVRHLQPGKSSVNTQLFFSNIIFVSVNFLTLQSFSSNHS